MPIIHAAQTEALYGSLNALEQLEADSTATIDPGHPNGRAEWDAWRAGHRLGYGYGQQHGYREGWRAGYIAAPHINRLKAMRDGYAAAQTQLATERDETIRGLRLQVAYLKRQLTELEGTP